MTSTCCLEDWECEHRGIPSLNEDYDGRGQDSKCEQYTPCDIAGQDKNAGM